MPNPKKKCSVCGEEFEVWDVKKPEETCGKRMCVQNLKYQKAHTNPWTGEVPNMEDIKKF